MRSEILAEIRALNITGFGVSDELPWDSSGTALYHKNKRTVYVSEPDVEDAVLINTLMGDGRITSRSRSLAVYLAVDAKHKPQNYDQLVTGILEIKQLFRDFIDVSVDLVNTLEDDTLLAEFEFRTTELRKQ